MFAAIAALLAGNSAVASAPVSKTPKAPAASPDVPVVKMPTPPAASVPAAPSIPAAPSVPALPSVPAAPSIPAAPSVAPAAPSIPTPPAAPKAPAAPAAPKAPAATKEPKAPKAPAVAFETLDEEGKREAVKKLTTKWSKKGKTTDIKALFAAYGAANVESVDASYLDHFNWAISTFDSNGQDMAAVLSTFGAQ